MENGEWRMENGKMENDICATKKPNVIRDKSFAYALRTVKLCRYLNTKKKEYTISKQLLRSGTAIGALVREAEHAESKQDFIHKLSIALKEANETDYWLDLLYQSEFISPPQYHSIHPETVELIKLLVSIINSSKANLTK